MNNTVTHLCYFTSELEIEPEDIISTDIDTRLQAWNFYKVKTGFAVKFSQGDIMVHFFQK